MDDGSLDFTAENATYEREKAAWLAAGLEGRWFSILGAEWVGPFDTCGKAWDGGMARFGRQGFLVEQLEREEHAVVISWVQGSNVPG